MYGKCHKHNVPYEIMELKQHPGKIIVVCPECRKDGVNKLKGIFRNIGYGATKYYLVDPVGVTNEM